MVLQLQVERIYSGIRGGICGGSGALFGGAMQAAQEIGSCAEALGRDAVPKLLHAMKSALPFPRVCVRRAFASTGGCRVLKVLHL